jgi:hypothetical protein
MGHVLMGLQAGSMNSSVGCSVQKLHQVKLLAVFLEDHAGKTGMQANLNNKLTKKVTNELAE